MWAQASAPHNYLEGRKEGLVYNASFQYKEHNMSGLLAMKKEETGYRIILLSKMGPSLMDFTITREGVHWEKKIAAIDKKAVNKAIVRDFRALLLTPLENPDKVKRKGSNRFKVKKEITILAKTDTLGRVVSVENKRFINLFKSFVRFYYTDEDAVPDEMCLTHRNIKLKIELNKIEQ